MDILELLKKDVQTLPEGAYIKGFKAVLRHLEAAEAHLTRGAGQPDDLAFTDAIYRCNQAFEGSLKEAYRVVAEKDPEKATIFSIENYLQKEKLFRDRVMAQFKSYRTEWRNPSTHDYTLDFDYDEALLAIMSVSAFAKLLLNQISEQLVFQQVKDELVNNPPSAGNEGADVVDQVGAALLDFAQNYAPQSDVKNYQESEAHLVGALSAYLTSALPAVTLLIDVPIGVQNRRRVDILAQREAEKVVVEVKRSANRMIVSQGLAQTEAYLIDAGAIGGVLFAFGSMGSSYTAKVVTQAGQNKIIVVAPEAAVEQLP